MDSNVLIIELNEFNDDLLNLASAQIHLPALQKILSFEKIHYKTPDRYNSGFLEPWVQWVCIHTGKPSKLHQIKHLGDIPDLHYPQCWEVLSQHGITTGVWGVMNGGRNGAVNVPFFVPDPWTFTEPAYPTKLQNLLSLPRYLAKNYQNLKTVSIIAKAIRLLGFMFTSGCAFITLKTAFSLLPLISKFGPRHFLFISYFEYISTLLFAQYKKKYNPRCSFLFLNSLAHLQHHYWTQGPNAITPEIKVGLQFIEKSLDHLLREFPNDAIVLHNGLSQMNTNHEKPWILYRQKAMNVFLKNMGIDAVKVESHMTHDCHVFFANHNDCDAAFVALKEARINNRPLFKVERNTQNPCKLFFELQFTDELSKDDHPEFICNNIKHAFFEHFDTIVKRTGRHVPIGTLYSNKIQFADQIFNHDFNKYLYHYLLPDTFNLRNNDHESSESLLLEQEEA